MTATHAPAATSAPQVRFNLLEHLSGRMRLVPVLASLVLVWAFFWTQQPAFLSPRNLTNLAMQMVVVATLALGLVLVLLVAEIDLSVAALSGAAAAIAGTAGDGPGVEPGAGLHHRARLRGAVGGDAGDGRPVRGSVVHRDAGWLARPRRHPPVAAAPGRTDRPGQQPAALHRRCLPGPECRVVTGPRNHRGLRRQRADPVPGPPSCRAATRT